MHDHGEVYLHVSDKRVIYSTDDLPTFRNKDEIEKRKIIAFAVKSAKPDSFLEKYLVTEYQFLVEGIQPGRQEIIWYEKTSVISWLIAGWQKITVVVLDAQLGVIFGPGQNPRFPNGSPDYNFFRRAFEILEKAGIAQGILQRFLSAVRRSPNGRIDFADVIPNHDRGGYFAALRWTMNRLHDAGRAGYDLDRIRELERLARDVVDHRAAELQRGIDRQDPGRVIDNHRAAVRAWENVAEFALWIISEVLSEGELPLPPPKI